MAEILPNKLEPKEGTITSKIMNGMGTFADTVATPLGKVGGIGPTLTESVSFMGGLTTPKRSDNVLTGPARDLYDKAFDYSGTWGGMKDQYDITGPSFDPRDLQTGGSSNGEPAFDWRKKGSAKNDPTNPSNWGVKVKMVVGVILLVVVVYVFKPLFEIIANLTE